VACAVLTVLLFTMTECRFQSARRLKKEAADYPRKTAGMVEYANFARGIDPRIGSACVWCPPDRVPDEECCTRRFSAEDQSASAGAFVAPSGTFTAIHLSA